MRLGIDAREIQEGVHTGIGRPLVNFIRYFGKKCLDDHCVLFSSKKIPLKFESNVTNIVIPEGQVFFWDQWHLPQAIKKADIDVFYSPYYKIPLLCSCKCVSALLDVMYLVFDEYKDNLSRLEKFYYATFGKAFAKKSDKILTCSQHSKKDILNIYPVDEEKIEVIPLSAGQIYYPEEDPSKIEAMKEKYHITGRYILYIGNFKVHKNVDSLIHAFNRIAVDFNDVQLVLVGSRTHKFRELVSLVEEYDLENRVIFTGKVTEKDEPHLLYSGAECFVFPSLYEGFGIPPLEAMSSGCPVIASNMTSIPEVVQNAGVLIDPQDIDQMAGAIKEFLLNTELKNEYRRKGLEQMKLFDENTIAKKTINFFKSVL